MAEKLYKYLIVDEAKLRESDCFEYYSAKEIYIKLRNKYESMLAVLEYLQGIGEIRISELKERKENNESIKNQILEKIETLKKENELNESDIERYESYYDGKLNDKEKRLFHAYTEEEKDALSEIFNLKKGLKNDSIIEEIVICEEGVKNIKYLKKVFYRSYGFNEKYINGKWINSCEKQTEVLKRLMEYTYVYIDNQSEEESAVSQTVLTVFKIMQVITDYFRKYAIWEERVKKVKNANDINQENLERLIESVRDGISDDEPRAFIEGIKVTLKKAACEAAVYVQVITFDTIYVEYDKKIKDVQNLLEEYDKCNSAIYGSYDKQMDKVKVKIIREKAKEKKKNIFNQIMDNLCEIGQLRNNALRKVKEFFEKEKKYVDENYYKEINGRLYKKLFGALRRETKEKIGGSSDSDQSKNTYYIHENRNGMYLYKDKIIMTLSFPNTQLDQFKRAAVIMDREFLDKVYRDSANAAWSYRHSRQASKTEYAQKTWKPDKVTINGGKTELAKLIYGDHSKEEEVYYITDSHKFDFRKDNIRKVDKLVRKPDMRYYGGKIRLDEENYRERICVNLKENRTEASILYFDDISLFCKFLDEI
mgnify:CR=1 FL=1